MQGQKAEKGVCRDGRERGEEEEEEEEEKIEKFFAILRNYREACNRRRSQLIGDLGRDGRQEEEEEEEEESKRKKMRLNRGLDVEHQGRSSSWIPRFELEDFRSSDVVEFRSRHPSAILPGPCIREEKKEAVEVEETEKSEKSYNDGLDLNLAL